MIRPKFEEESMTTIETMLARAGLQLSPEELEAISAAYEQQADGIDALYTLAELRYESPALVFDPIPVFADWDASDDAGAKQ